MGIFGAERAPVDGDGILITRMEGVYIGRLVFLLLCGLISD